MPVDLYEGDCLTVMKLLPDNSVDSIVCDPPYHLTQASRGGSPRKNNPETPFGRHRLHDKGFMSMQWDGGDIAFRVEVWEEALRILKPGGHLLAFGGTRTQHRMVCAIEDAGFTILDFFVWCYSSGFPKSVNVSNQIDKLERGYPQGVADPDSPNHGKYKSGCSEENEDGRGFGTGPGSFMKETGNKVERELSETAKRWEGFG